MSTMSTVYFIQQGQDGPIKIGVSKKVKERLRELQVANPFMLRIIFQIRGTIELERALHDRFSQYRLEGEWFKNGLKIRQYIKRAESFIFTLKEMGYTINNSTSSLFYPHVLKEVTKLLKHRDRQKKEEENEEINDYSI